MQQYRQIEPHLWIDPQTELSPIRTPFWKRCFDIIGAILFLVILSPLFVIIVILQQLESPGSVFYSVERVGAGYRIFRFYKFRSMIKDADKQLNALAQTQNQYKGSGEHYLFVKIHNDPRVTRFGAFLRKTGLDELPQLFNVLKGDMSIVGNRPIPLYEARHLLKMKYLERFQAPGGITGLWQVTKRGKAEMSEQERISLDNEYVSTMNLYTDLKILLKTPVAMIQEVSA